MITLMVEIPICWLLNTIDLETAMCNVTQTIKPMSELIVMKAMNQVSIKNLNNRKK